MRLAASAVVLASCLTSCTAILQPRPYGSIGAGAFHMTHTPPSFAARRLMGLDPDAHIDESKAVRARRRLRLGAGRHWMWEPQGETDPGISWETMGVARAVKVFPRAKGGKAKRCAAMVKFD